MNNLYDGVFSDTNHGLLIASIMATILLIAIIAIISGYLYSFKKKSENKTTKISIINWTILTIIFSSFAVNLIIVILLWLFGEGVIGSGKSGVIATIVVSFILSLTVAIYVVFFLHYIAVSISDREISFLGERILLTKINDVVVDKKLNLLIIKHTEGKKNKKTTKWKMNTLTGRFMKKNINLFQPSLLEDAVDVKRIQNINNWS